MKLWLYILLEVVVNSKIKRVERIVKICIQYTNNTENCPVLKVYGYWWVYWIENERGRVLSRTKDFLPCWSLSHANSLELK